jgi:hypothetical protein
VKAAANDRHTLERPCEGTTLLGVDDRGLERCVGQLHHMRSWLRRTPKASGQVDCEQVEPTRAQPKGGCLRVDNDVVPERDRPREARIGDARKAVDMESHETWSSLEDPGHPPATQANWRHLELAR